MPFFLLLVGMIFLVAAIRGNQSELIDLAKSDFSGSNNFFLWVMAIVVIVLLGNFKVIKPISDAFLGLIILVIVVANYKNGSNLINNFVNQVRRGTS